MSPVILHASSSLLIHILEAAARSLALAGLAALALALLKVKKTSVKILLWRGVLLASLLMPLLQLLIPPVHMRVPLPSSEMSRVADGGEPVHANALGDAPKILLPVELSSTSKSREGFAASAPHLSEIPWSFVLAAAYLTISMLLFVRILVGARWTRRLARTGRPIRDSLVLGALNVSARGLAVRTLPSLSESDALSVPITIGILNPVILLPATWRNWQSDEVRAVLAHEMSHIARRDAVGQRLALVHRAMFWFSPLAWWLNGHLASLAEQASDEAALAEGMERTRYAEMLLAFFAGAKASPQRIRWQGISMANGGMAAKRVDRILAWRKPMANKLRKSALAALFGAAVPVIALTASLHPFVSNAQEPPAAVAPQLRSAPAEPAPVGHPVVTPQPARQVPSVVSVVPSPARATAPPPAAPGMIPELAQTRESGSRIVGNYYDSGPRFVIVRSGSEGVTMSGSFEDAEHARALRGKISGDFIWFERDEKSYVIRDPATVARAIKFWAPEEELGKKQEELGKQQEALGKQQEELGRKQQEVSVKVPDLTAQLQEIGAELKQLSTNGGTMEQIGELQGKIGELQSRIGEIQGDAARQQGKLGNVQGELGRKQGELGRQQGELGRKQGELSKQAMHQMKQLLDEALASGLARPE
jgi:beta-lactamase regulating signal transducer with metallopeptidase domain